MHKVYCCSIRFPFGMPMCAFTLPGQGAQDISDVHIIHGSPPSPWQAIPDEPAAQSRVLAATRQARRQDISNFISLCLLLPIVFIRPFLCHLSLLIQPILGPGAPKQRLSSPLPTAVRAFMCFARILHIQPFPPSSARVQVHYCPHSFVVNLTRAYECPPQFLGR